MSIGGSSPLASPRSQRTPSHGSHTHGSSGRSHRIRRALATTVETARDLRQRNRLIFANLRLKKKELKASDFATECIDAKAGKEADLELVDGDAPDEEEENPYSDNFVGRLAGHNVFEAVTITVICLNALVIGWDADYTARFAKPDVYVFGILYQGPVYFVVLEYFFAIYFSAEIIIRLLAYKRTKDCLRSGWFLFDSVLVTMMVLDTWILPIAGLGGAMAQFGILRLVRMVRIAKFLKAFPELMMLIKGMAAAMRAVVWTGVLMILLVFAFAIMFTNEFHQGKVADADVEDDIHILFGSMGKSMFSLFVMGSILDDVTYATDSIRATKKGMMLFCFLTFIVVSAFMMLNLLVGIMAEVVMSSAESEKADIRAHAMRQAMKQVLSQLDNDKSGNITRSEYMAMKGHPELKASLEDLQVSDRHFFQFAELMFQEPDHEYGSQEEPYLSVEEVIDMILRLQPGNKLSKLDFANMQAKMTDSTNQIEARVLEMEQKVHELCSARMATLELDKQAAATALVGKEKALLDVVQQSKTRRQVSKADSHFSLPGQVEDEETAEGDGKMEDEALAEADDRTKARDVDLRSAGIGDDAVAPPACHETTDSDTISDGLGKSTFLPKLKVAGEDQILQELCRRFGITAEPVIPRVISCHPQPQPPATPDGPSAVRNPSHLSPAPHPAIEMISVISEDLYDVETDCSNELQPPLRGLSSDDMEELSC